MRSMIKDAAVLFIITLIAGALLGGVFFVTKDPIEIQNQKKKDEAYRIVFEDASSFEETDIAFPDDGMFLNDWEKKGFKGIKVEKTVKAKGADGGDAGYVLMVRTNAGYGGDISFAMGIRKDGMLNGISLLEISETAGLGMKAPDVLVPQFASKKISEFSVTKNGSTSESEIDAISGATITSKAITNAVNAGMYYFDIKLGGAVNE